MDDSVCCAMRDMIVERYIDMHGCGCWIRFTITRWVNEYDRCKSTRIDL